MAEEPMPDFLSLPAREYHSDDDLRSAIQPALDTLFPSYPARNRSISPATLSSSSRRLPLARHNRSTNEQQPAVDLRALDHISEYDSHLMCPICHVPFIDPVVLDCDHTFCASCFDEYRHGTTGNEGSHCPSCRTFILASPKKASRLISNMCNDIKVHCPNEGCLTVIARGYVERHILKDCMEQTLPCPGSKCEKEIKRKSYVPGQCIHETHVECDCGAVIELGRGEWLKHKDEDCPNTGVRCERCSERISVKDYLDHDKTHDCGAEVEVQQCPGLEFGCRDSFDSEGIEAHILLCPLARLAPYLTRQNRLLHSLAEQLSQVKMRNETLETGLERINEVLTTQIQPKISNLPVSEADDVEEIERDHIPGTTSFHHPQRDLLLPAHIRELTPSPTFSSSNPAHLLHPFQSSPAGRSTSSTTSHQHLISLHDSLRNSITSLETDLHQLHVNMTEIDGRSSMQIMNETLRLKEELAHTNAALFSTRAQVQWLLNRERMGMSANMNMNANAGMHPNMMRGRQESTDQATPGTDTQTMGDMATGNRTPAATSAASPQASETSFGHNRTASTVSNVGGQSSTSASPMFGATSPSSTRRPSVRRQSGSSSQERFKL